MTRLTVLDWITLILVIVGGLNWGLISLNPDWDIVSTIFGRETIFSSIVFGLVGASAFTSFL